MKTKILFTLALSVLIIQGCASREKTELTVKGLTAVASQDQKNDPYGAVVSKKKHMVSISYYKDLGYIKDKAVFNMIVKNGGENPFKISDNSISVVFKKNGKNRQRVHVQSLPEFIKDTEYDFQNDEKEKIKLIFMDVESTARRIDSSSSDEAKKSMAEIFAMKFTNKVQKIQYRREQYNQRENIYLKEQTIMPGDSISTIISCDTREIPHEIIGNFEVTVSIDGEEHNFTFIREL